MKPLLIIGLLALSAVCALWLWPARDPVAAPASKETDTVSISGGPAVGEPSGPGLSVEPAVASNMGSAMGGLSRPAASYADAVDVASPDDGDPTSFPEEAGPGKNTADASVASPSGLPVNRGPVEPTELATTLEYEIPAGMRAPVVFLPEDRPLTPPMEKFLENVRDEFDATIAAADDPATVWEAARQQADDRYRLLFGDDAYNQKTMRDAIEALKSKNPPPAPSPVPPAP